MNCSSLEKYINSSTPFLERWFSRAFTSNVCSLNLVFGLVPPRLGHSPQGSYVRSAKSLNIDGRYPELELPKNKGRALPLDQRVYVNTVGPRRMPDIKTW